MNSISTKLFLASLTLVALVGCNRYSTELKADKTTSKAVTVREIAMIVPDQNNPWTKLQIEFAQMAAKDANVTLHVIPIEGSTEEDVQAALGAAAAARSAGALLQAPSESAGIFVRDGAESFGMQILAINQRLKDMDTKKYLNMPYFGIENRDLGSFLAQNMMDEAAKRGWKPADTGVVVLTQDDGGKFAARGQAIADTLRAAGYTTDQIRIVRYANRADAQSKVGAVVSSAKPHWMILGGADAPVLGAAETISAKGMSGDNVIAASIGGLGALDELAKPSGVFYGTLLVGPRLHSYAVTTRLVTAMKSGLDVDPLPTFNNGVWITRANLAEATKTEMLDKLPEYAKTLQP